MDLDPITPRRFVGKSSARPAACARPESCHEQAGSAEAAAYRIELEPERLQSHGTEERLVPWAAEDDF